MNVLIISPDTKGTIAGLSYNLCFAFTSQGYNAYIACINGRESELPKGLNAIVLTSKLGKIKSKLIRHVVIPKLLRKIINEKKIDYTISTLLGCNLYNVISKTKRDVKIGLFHTDPMQSKYLGGARHLIFNAAYRYVLPRLDTVISVNKTALLSIKKQFNISSELVYNIHDFNRIDELSKDVLEDDNIIFKKPTILFIGHLTPVKGPERLIKAFSEIDGFENYSLCFIGEGYMYQELKKIAEDVGVDEYTYFLGYKSNPYKYLARSCCLVLPSQDEGLPGVLIEALSLNVKVVSTNSSLGVWEIMQCEDAYSKELMEPYYNEFGAITPNFMGSDNGEQSTVYHLSQAISQVLNTTHRAPANFDKHRFTAAPIVAQYMQIYNNIIKKNNQSDTY